MTDAARIEDRMNLPRSIPAVIVTLCLHAALMHATQTASCTFSTFSAPSAYTLNAVNGIADDGTVVGVLTDNKTLAPVAFSYSANGEFTEYTAPQSSGTWLYGGNASGTNAGSYQDAKAAHMHGFFLQGKQFSAVDYPKATNTWLFDVNQVGSAVGSYSNGSVTKGFQLVNGKYTTIAYPQAQLTYAQSVNNNGVVAGSFASGFNSNGFLWENKKFTVINFPRSKYGSALVGVNNSSVVVGNYFNGDFTLGFIYENGVFKKITYPGAWYAATGGINNNGVISGLIVFSNTSNLGYTAVCK
jgi:hypothetical protein